MPLWKISCGAALFIADSMKVKMPNRENVGKNIIFRLDEKPLRLSNGFLLIASKDPMQILKLLPTKYVCTVKAYDVWGGKAMLEKPHAFGSNLSQ